MAIPIGVLILAFSAIPTELRWPRREVFDEVLWADLYERDVPDIVANVVGYVPLGAVLAGRAAGQAIGGAASVSLLAEAAQCFAAGRTPSLMDVAMNVLGAMMGFALARRWKRVPDRIAMSGRVAALAGVLAVAAAGLGVFATPRDLEEDVTVMMEAPPWLERNPRGATAPGTLEARWTFDGGREGVVIDDSGHGLAATPVNGPVIAPGVVGGAVVLNGVNQWLDAGSPAALRLPGTMSISAWINSSRYPPDDAAIVSDYGVLGYQLDTTVDEGKRTIGFKLADASGRPMFRYGATPLRTGRWYHVAGVYDATARTMDVYLDGRLDNGLLCGTVTSRQHVSPLPTFVGRRGDRTGFEFAGTIDDVRIYSQALSGPEIAAQVALVARETGWRPSSGPADRQDRGSSPRRDSCFPAEPTDARLTGLIVAVGMLTGVAAVGLWSTTGWRTACLVSSFLAGLLLLPALSSLLPSLFRWFVPVLTLAGGATVAACTADAQPGGS